MGNWIKGNINLVISFCIGVLLTSLFFMLFQKQKEIETIREIEKPVVEIKTETKTDTITITKTIPKPEYISESILKTDTLTIIQNDTIVRDTIVEMVQRHYTTQINNDSIKGTINTTISGYNPVLDTLNYNLSIYPKTITNTIETTITKYKTKHWNFTVGVGAGYGLINRRPDIFVGGMVGYTF